MIFLPSVPRNFKAPDSFSPFVHCLYLKLDNRDFDPLYDTSSAFIHFQHVRIKDAD